LLFALMAAATAEGCWAAVVGLPGCGALAAAELGVAVHRLALVPRPGRDQGEVEKTVAALLDGFDLVALATPVTPATSRKLSARARHRKAVLLPFTVPWPGSDVELTATSGQWTGLSTGHGLLTTHTVTVQATGRGAAARPRRTTVVLPGNTDVPSHRPTLAPVPPTAPPPPPTAPPPHRPSAGSPRTGPPTSGPPTPTSPTADLPAAVPPTFGSPSTVPPAAGPAAAGSRGTGLRAAGLVAAGASAAGLPAIGLSDNGLPVAGLAAAGTSGSGLRAAVSAVAGASSTDVPAAGLSAAGALSAGLSACRSVSAGLSAVDRSVVGSSSTRSPADRPVAAGSPNRVPAGPPADSSMPSNTCLAFPTPVEAG
jgi:hypothetical protein